MTESQKFLLSIWRGKSDSAAMDFGSYMDADDGRRRAYEQWGESREWIGRDEAERVRRTRGRGMEDLERKGREGERFVEKRDGGVVEG